MIISSRILAVFALCSFFLGVPLVFADAPSAVTAAFVCTKNIDAVQGQKLVSTVQENFTRVKTMRAQFYQDSYLSSVDQSEISSGKVSLMREGKMRWHYESPEEQIFIVKDSSLWLYQPRLNQVVVDSLETVLISQLPTAFLMGVGDLTKDFTLKSSCDTRTAILLSLAPSSNSADSGDLSSFDLLVDRATFLPLGAQVVDIAANRTSILMRSVVADDKSVVEKDFEFTTPIGIDIDDRRKAL